MEEMWKSLIEFDDRYEVSSLGRVRGPRTVSYGTKGTNGYMQVCISRKTKNVHVLVALAFIGERPSGMHICHRDGDKTNNALSNLRYGTPVENWKDFRVSGASSTHAISRTLCPLGHRLEAPNLVVSQLKRGWRSCLSCSRAHAYIRNGKNGKYRNHSELANQYYERIEEW